MELPPCHARRRPAGVYNVVTTKKAVEVGAELTSNPVVRKISFTGSTNVGKQLMKQSSQTMQRMSLELGGNAPFIVFDDADLDAAVEGLINSKFRNTGQTCVCANRVFVQKGIYDAFAARLADRVRALKVGHGYDPDVRQGPLIDVKALEKVKRHVDDAVGSGAAVSVGGKPHALGRSFFEPTVLVNCTPSMLLAREETFGPVAGLIPFETESAVVAMANDTPFGLAGYFFSRDLGRIFRVAEALEVGMVGVNEGLISTEVAPFGGVKESGMGREGSKDGLQEYMETKYLCLGGI
ncbi:aldehyde dehydrogenase domain-containing protein [Zopfochytrium polystomum]|nr:aldehyde dehydrogenase domain-containing protein [Zopfochytrium polystomum]